MKTKTTKTTIAGYKTGKIVPWLQGFFNLYTGNGKHEAKFEAIEAGAETFGSILVVNMPEGEDRNRVLSTLRAIVLTANNSIQLESAVPVPFLGHASASGLGLGGIPAV